MPTSKIYANAAAALFDLKDGITLMSGGFGLCGIAENCIDQIERMGIANLKAISNNIGNQGKGLAKLLKKHQISRAVCSYVGGNPDLEQQMRMARGPVAVRQDDRRARAEVGVVLIQRRVVGRAEEVLRGHRAVRRNRQPDDGLGQGARRRRTRPRWR